MTWSRAIGLHCPQVATSQVSVEAYYNDWSRIITTSIHHQHPSPASTTSIHHQHPPPASTTSIHHQHPSPASTTSIHHQHPPPASITSIHHQHPPPASTTSIHHQHPSPASTTIPLFLSRKYSNKTSPYSRCRSSSHIKKMIIRDSSVGLEYFSNEDPELKYKLTREAN
ncbi:serine-rich adhesin for platelets-like X3 [Biomphalaria glabrata]